MRVKIHKCRNISHPFPIFGWMIMAVQKMNPFKRDSWSHMSMEFYGVVHEITFDGYKKSSLYDFVKDYKIIETIEFDLEIIKEVFEDWIGQYKEVEYDFKQVAGLFIKSTGASKFNRIGNDFEKLICNELVISYLVRFHGLVISDSDDFDLNSTWELLEKYDAC